MAVICLFLWLLLCIFSLSLVFHNLIMKCLCVVSYFPFLLHTSKVCQAFWIYSLIVFIKFGHLQTSVPKIYFPIPFWSWYSVFQLNDYSFFFILQVTEDPIFIFSLFKNYFSEFPFLYFLLDCFQVSWYFSFALSNMPMSVSSEVLIWDVIFFSSIISTWLFFISFISHLIMSMFYFKSLSIFIIDILMSLLLPLSLSFLIPFPLTIYCSCWTLWIIYYWVSGFCCIPFIMVWILFSRQLTYLCISMILSRIVLNFQKKRFKINSIFRPSCMYDSGVTLLYLLLDVQGVHRHFPVWLLGTWMFPRPTCNLIIHRLTTAW